MIRIESVWRLAAPALLGAALAAVAAIAAVAPRVSGAAPAAKPAGPEIPLPAIRDVTLPNGA
ncbi:MAG TPA: hypothetical protein VFT32_09590, partial [Candidatus Eisenbacteria bacterium]|nr:hypothetical protein [Candidatus Eisenbacteria bacterium]